MVSSNWYENWKPTILRSSTASRRPGISFIDNVQGPVEAIEFVHSGYPEGESVLRLEAWTASSTLAPGNPPRQYVVGDLVTHDGQLYRCIADSTGEVPPENPASWELLPPPADDLRVVAGTAYEGLGIH